MVHLPFLVAAASAALARSVAYGPQSHVTREGSELKFRGQRWTASGINAYWLGLDENVIPPAGQPFYPPLNASYPTFERITEAFNTFNILGVNAVRAHTLGVSTGNPLSLEPSLDVWNEQAFSTIDWAVYQAGTHSVKLQIPLTDNYDYYHGGKYNFLRWRGFNITFTDPASPLSLQFYTNETIICDFKNYIRKLLTHVNPYTKLSYAEDPTIFAYETGNELSGIVHADGNVPNEWTQDIARFIKSLAPSKLVIDGSLTFNASHLSIPEVDIYSNHFYPVDTSVIQSDIAATAAANKTYLIGEYDWRTAGSPDSSVAKMFSIVESHQKPASPQVVVGDLPWSFFGRNAPDCSTFVNHTDGYSFLYNDPNNTAAITESIVAVRQHLWRLRGKNVGTDLPQAPCPGPTRG
ncbi:glycoside hydrolase family 5 protein [Myriangium duriaei CBS 260.36]|uniref:mannan endo-1,4-beta-mannosidase n=1 Tax=Myriangium duriaei CBS 260.36 TaxID=1168546 RepID=A0A9P4MET6_9PEZI|nr:glycoside hydrolase family 5 protein [Myriangium duriaei CBS 260.36]